MLGLFHWQTDGSVGCFSLSYFNTTAICILLCFCEATPSAILGMGVLFHVITVYLTLFHAITIYRILFHVITIYLTL